MTRTDIAKTIVQNLQASFVEEQFERHYGGQAIQFRKQFTGGYRACLFEISESQQHGEGGNSGSLLANHLPKFWIEFSIGVRIHTVENFANPYTLTLKDYYNQSLTILTSYGRMIDQQYFRFKISNEADLQSACQQMDIFLRQTALPFLQKYSSIYKLDKLLNNYPERPSKFIYNQSHRCIKGIVIAKLSNNPYFHTLAKAYKIVLERQSLGQELMPKYLKLLACLRAFSVN